MEQLLLQEFMTFLQYKQWDKLDRLFTKNELYKAFNAGATASLGALSQVANRIQKDSTEIVNCPERLL